MSIRYRDQIIGGSEKFIQVTKAQYDILVANERLIPGAIYNIIDDVTEDIAQGNGIVDENYLPAGTVITVKKDGTGDFTDVVAAITYLDGKFCPSKVTIQIYPGTYSIPVDLKIRGSRSNFSSISIEGTDMDTVILQRAEVGGSYSSALTIGAYDDCGCPIYLSNLTIDSISNRGDGSYTRGLVLRSSIVLLSNIHIKNCDSDALLVQTSRCILASGSLKFTNVPTGLYSSASLVQARGGVNLIGNGVTTYLSVGQGGIIQLSGAVKTFTNVTNQSSQTIGLANDNGFISGTWN